MGFLLGSLLDVNGDLTESGLDVAGLEMVVVVVGYGSVVGKRETSGDSWSSEVGGGGDRRFWWPERG
ncbi:hypothetical protein Hanom_Chr06g00483341 [Helianthus anomalus]